MQTTFIKNARFVVSLATIGIALSTMLPAQAGEVQNRIDRQQQRINQGVQSGQLTHAEYARDESHLRSDERARNRDLRLHGGHLTAAERAHLNRRLSRNSDRIYDTKHNLNHQ